MLCVYLGVCVRHYVVCTLKCVVCECIVYVLFALICVTL